MTVTYDERDQPADVLFHDPDHNLLQRVVFTRDRDGRLVSEEIVRGELLQNALDSAPPEERARANALLATVFGPDQTLSRTTYAYDQRGRRVERRTRMGTLGENRTTFRYDDYDNPVEETTEDRSREVNIDENGIEEVTAETVQRQHARFEYQYDAQGNWTERVVLSRAEPNPDFRRENVERRNIAYYII